MRYTTQKQTRIICKETAEAFESELNGVLTKLYAKRIEPQITFNTSCGFCAYVVWDETKMEAETLAEEYELCGQSFKCKDCKFYRPSPDGRIKFTRCQFSPIRISRESNACEQFYKLLDSGHELEVLREEGGNY